MKTSKCNITLPPNPTLTTCPTKYPVDIAESVVQYSLCVPRNLTALMLIKSIKTVHATIWLSSVWSLASLTFIHYSEWLDSIQGGGQETGAGHGGCGGRGGGLPPLAGGRLLQQLPGPWWRAPGPVPQPRQVGGEGAGGGTQGRGRVPGARQQAGGAHPQVEAGGQCRGSAAEDEEDLSDEDSRIQWQVTNQNSQYCCHSCHHITGGGQWKGVREISSRTL